MKAYDSQLYTENLDWKALFNKIKSPAPAKMFSERCEKCFYRVDNICAVVKPAMVFSELKKCKQGWGFAHKTNDKSFTLGLSAVIGDSVNFRNRRLK